MRKFVVGFLLCVWCSVSDAVPARVGYIVDGDTFAATVKLDGGVDVSVRVRIRNIDTPEIHGDCEYEREMAVRARERLGQLIPAGTTVNLDNIKDDKYLGRIDANVTDSHGRDIGDVMVHEKLARRYNGGRRKPWCER